MGEYYDVTYTYCGIKITKLHDDDLMIEIFSDDGTSLVQLIEEGSYYIVYSDIWDRSEIGHITVSSIEHQFAPDGRLVNTSLIENNIFETSIDLENSDKNLLIRFSNGQLGDAINFQSYVLDFLGQKGHLFSTITIQARLYSLWLNVFSEYNPIPIYNPDTGELESIVLEGGKYIIRDVDDEISDISFDISIGIGLMEFKDFVHPQGINILNQLNMEYKPYSRLKLENYYEAIDHQSKYVCIAPCGTMKAKMWISYDCEIDKWQTLVDYLVNIGYEVWWISKEECNLENIVDLSGDDYSIENRIEQILGCEFVVTVASGLSWLANACGVHVFRINSWSWGWTEFKENTTIIENNNAGCRGCFNDGSLDKAEFHYEYCPRQMDFICSKSISVSQVIDSIENYIGEDKEMKKI